MSWNIHCPSFPVQRALEQAKMELLKIFSNYLFGRRSQCALLFPLCTFGGLFSPALTKARKCNLLYSAALEPIFCFFFLLLEIASHGVFFFCHISKSLLYMDLAVQNFQNCDYIQSRFQEVTLTSIVTLMLLHLLVQYCSLVTFSYQIFLCIQG